MRKSEVSGSQEEKPQSTILAAPEESRANLEDLPIEDYASLNVYKVCDQLGEMNIEEIKELCAYEEAKHKNRQSLLERADVMTEAGST